MRYIVGDECLAEDIVQETFLRIWKKRMWRDEGFYTLIMRMGTNLCYDYFRKSKSKLKLSENITRRQKKVLSPEDIFLKEHLEKKINNVIENEISESARKIFKLRSDEKMSTNNISDKLSMSKRTIDNRIYRIRKKLKKLKEVKEVYAK